MTSKGHLSHKHLPLSEQRWLSSQWGTSASWHCNFLPLVWLSQIWEGSKPVGLEDLQWEKDVKLTFSFLRAANNNGGQELH